MKFITTFLIWTSKLYLGIKIPSIDELRILQVKTNTSEET